MFPITSFPLLHCHVARPFSFFCVGAFSFPAPTIDYRGAICFLYNLCPHTKKEKPGSGYVRLTLSWILRPPSNMKASSVCGTYIFVNEKPAIQFTTTLDSTLHFVKLNSRQIQIIKQMPNILLIRYLTSWHSES